MANESLAVLAPPVFVLPPFLGIPPVHVHVLSMSIVLPPDIAIVFGVAIRPATRSNYRSRQQGCKQKRNELPEQRAHSSPVHLDADVVPMPFPVFSYSSRTQLSLERRM